MCILVAMCSPCAPCVPCVRYLRLKIGFDRLGKRRVYFSLRVGRVLDTYSFNIDFDRFSKHRVYLSRRVLVLNLKA